MGISSRKPQAVNDHLVDSGGVTMSEEDLPLSRTVGAERLTKHPDKNHTGFSCICLSMYLSIYVYSVCFCQSNFLFIYLSIEQVDVHLYACSISTYVYTYNMRI